MRSNTPKSYKILRIKRSKWAGAALWPAARRPAHGSSMERPSKMKQPSTVWPLAPIPAIYPLQRCRPRAWSSDARGRRMPQGDQFTFARMSRASAAGGIRDRAATTIPVNRDIHMDDLDQNITNKIAAADGCPSASPPASATGTGGFGRAPVRSPARRPNARPSSRRG